MFFRFLAISINRHEGQPAKCAHTPSGRGGIYFSPCQKWRAKLLKSGFGRKDPQGKGAMGLKEIQVKVLDNDLEKAMRILKKKIQNDGLFKRLKLKKSYEKPSEYKRRKQREALRRQRIAAAKAARYRR
jgi:small subunit ribosomal protein S21